MGMKQGGIWGTQRTRPLDWVCFSFGFEPIEMGNRGLQRGLARCNGEDVGDSSLGQEGAIVVVSVCVCGASYGSLAFAPFFCGEMWKERTLSKTQSFQNKK